MAINFGGTLYAWNSGQVIALFVVSGILFIVFGIQQKIALFTTTTSRMFPVHFFKNKEALLLFILAASCNACVFIAIYYIPIYFQFTKQDTALDSAVRLLPLIIILSFTILLNGFTMSKLGFYQPWYVGGSILALIASVLLCKFIGLSYFSISPLTLCTARIDTNTPQANIYGFEILLGIGTGAYVQAGYAVIQAVVDPADIYYAISFLMMGKFRSAPNSPKSHTGSTNRRHRPRPRDRQLSICQYRAERINHYPPQYTLFGASTSYFGDQ